MGDCVPGGLSQGHSRHSGEQQRLFPNRCGACPLFRICGERESATSCGDPAEYRMGALHPAIVEFHPGDEQRYEFPDPPLWAPSVELPLVVPVAPEGTREFMGATAMDAKAALALDGRAAVPIACLAGDDQSLERIWLRRSRLGKDLASAGVRLVIAPPFSTWWSDPPFEGLHEIARTAEVASRLARQVNTVPSIAWRTWRDLQRWMTWFSRSPPTAIAFDLSTLKHPEKWEWALDGLAKVERGFASMNCTPRLVAIGPSAVSRLRDLGTVWPHRITLASRAVWQLSKAGALQLADGTRLEAANEELSVLLQSNVAEMGKALRSTQPIGGGADGRPLLDQVPPATH
jgi:hypothetical protein